MTATYTLVNPLVGILIGTGTISTLPIGAVVKLLSSGRFGLVIVDSEGQQYSMFLHDLMDACEIDDVGRIVGLGGHENWV